MIYVKGMFIPECDAICDVIVEGMSKVGKNILDRERAKERTIKSKKNELKQLQDEVTERNYLYFKNKKSRT